MSKTMLLKSAVSLKRNCFKANELVCLLSAQRRSTPKSVQNVAPSEQSSMHSTNQPIPNLKTPDDNNNASTTTGKVSTFAKSFGKIGLSDSQSTEHKNFANLLRNSKLMQIGNSDGRIVLGTIFDVVEDDLYIDFGGKFHCVCKRPTHRDRDYVNGAKVKLKLKDFEMTAAFLGSDKHVTLLEADGILIGLHRSNQWAIS